MLGLLRPRDVRLFLLGQTLSLFGDTVLYLALGIWVKSLTGSNRGWIIASWSGSWLPLPWPAPIIFSRGLLDRRWKWTRAPPPNYRDPRLAPVAPPTDQTSS